ncbi:MAG TPA: HD-GYP domain-containing protein [Anaerolineaceae bacterium]|jgi:putative nucleotidyltransferase with HDIG domain|nr:HD-GYP domain-containing protein [Anaerolineaceae bacterium]
MRKWKALQRQILARSAQVAKNDFDVQENLNNYRLILSEAMFKPAKVDQEIWETYRKIVSESPELRRKSLRTPLYLQSRKKLEAIDRAWGDLLREQEMLLEMLDKAPKTIDFYNRIHLARIQRHEQEKTDAEVADQTARAKDAVEKALASLDQKNEYGQTAPLNSTILRLEDARSFWRKRLSEVVQLETNARMQPDEMVSIFRNLEDTIGELPSMAEQVKEVEVMFIRLMTLHEELSSFGKNIIPPDDLSHMLVTVQDEIPHLWATGSWEKLRKCLVEVKAFIKHYDLTVRTELSVAERRKPSGSNMTRAMLAGTNSLPINEAIPLIRSLVSAIDARDPYMRGHSNQVAQLSKQIAAKLNWNSEDQDVLEIAALLHDVGKIMVPEAVLTKTTPLSPEEWKSIQMHPNYGAKISKPLTSLSKIVPWIYHHQERWDGSGYPDGLKKTDIPLPARLIAVSEAFTAMTTDLSSRKALSIDQALNEVENGAGTQFDPEIAEALTQAVQSAPNSVTPAP